MSKIKVRLSIKNNMPVMKYGNYTIETKKTGILSQNTEYSVFFGSKVVYINYDFNKIFDFITEKKSARRKTIIENPNQLKMEL